MQNETGINALDIMEQDGDLSYPVTSTELQRKARANWSGDRGVMTFFEELPNKTFHSKEEIIEAAPGDTGT